jgi:uncharacterized protein (TIGR04255 family)
LGSDWPNLRELPAQELPRETFGPEHLWELVLKLEITKEPPYRLQIRNDDNTRMIQLQNGSFQYHWLGPSPTQYPEYVEIRNEFREKFNAFASYITAENLGDMVPIQWEVAYFNHIPKGTVWNSPAEWINLFRLPGVHASNPASTILESIGGEWHYQIPPQKGRLHISVKHGRKAKQESLLINLTARGPLTDEDKKDHIEEGLDLGHRVVVNAFRDITSEKAHEYWELYDEQDAKL